MSNYYVIRWISSYGRQAVYLASLRMGDAPTTNLNLAHRCATLADASTLLTDVASGSAVNPRIVRVGLSQPRWEVVEE